MEENNDTRVQWYLHDYPNDTEEATEKWEVLVKTIQMLQVLYKISDDKIEKVIQLALTD